MREHLTLSMYLPDFDHPTRGLIALRDIANIPSAALKPFFTDPNVLDDVAQSDAHDPTPSVVWDEEDNRFIVNERLVPKQGCVYSIAADLSVNGDSTGISMVHIESDGRIHLDFSIQIQAKPVVKYEPIEDFFISLRDDYGFTVLGISFDQFQSHRTIERLEKEGFNVKVVRYAETVKGHMTLLEAVHSGMFVFYALRDAILIGEAKELQNVNDRRIDHLQTGGIYNSKDVWDSAVNASCRALEDKASAGISLSEDDVHLIDWVEEERVLASQKKHQRRWAHFAFLYVRIDEEKDPNIFVLVRVAKHVSKEIIVPIEVVRRHEPLISMVKTLLSLLGSWKKGSILSSIDDFPIEVLTSKSPAAGAFSDRLYDENSDFILSQTSDPLSEEARIEAVKDLIRKGTVTFPQRWFEDHELGRLVRRLLSHPYISDNYDLLALGGAIKNAMEIEIVVDEDPDKRLPKPAKRIREKKQQGW